MKIIKPSKLSVLTRPYEYQGRQWMAFSVLTMFSLDGSGKLWPEMAMWPLVQQILGRDGVLDEVLPKARGEWMLGGAAFAPEGKPVAELAVRAQLGTISKTLQLKGARQWQAKAGGWQASDAEPFTVLPLSWGLAFGGQDEVRNPLGIGHQLEGPWDNVPLPQIEQIATPLKQPDQSVEPAGFLPRDLNHPERRALTGTYDEQWKKTRFPGFADDLDFRAFNVAPADQQLEAGFWQGDEAFELVNLHPEQRVLSGQLPALNARLLMVNLREGQAQAFELMPVLDTVWFFPQAKMGVLAYRATLEVSDEEVPECLALLAALETHTAPRSAEYYLDELKRRYDSKQADMAILDDSPLLPAGQAEPLIPPQTEDDQGPQMRNQRRRAEKAFAARKEELHTLRAQMATRPGSEEALARIDAALAQEMPSPPPPFSIERIPAMMEEAEQQKKVAKEQFEQQRTALRAQLQEAAQAAGTTPEALLAKGRQGGGGPPKPQAPQLRAQLNAMAQQAAQNGREMPPVDPNILPKLEQADALQLAQYRLSAHLAPPPTPLGPMGRNMLRQEVLRALDQGASLVGRNLTGADLSGIDFSHANLSEVLLESADLSTCKFDHANLKGAVLARTQLKGASFVEANLELTNLGRAQARGVDFSRSQCQGARFGWADLSAACFTGAQLKEADLTGTTLADINFSHAVLDAANFMAVPPPEPEGDPLDVDPFAPLPTELTPLLLARCNFTGASLFNANFIKTELDGCDFSGARLTRATFFQARAHKVSFRGALLDKTQFVGGCDCRGSDFSEANLSEFFARDANLQHCNFRNAQVSNAMLSRNDLTGADFTEANLVQARLDRSNCFGARFVGANLRDAILRKADLSAADFTGANLFRAEATRIIRTPETLFDNARLLFSVLKNEEEKPT